MSGAWVPESLPVRCDHSRDAPAGAQSDRRPEEDL